MSTDHATSTLAVSLEDHLADTLRPLIPLLPKPLAADLDSILATAPAPPKYPSADADPAPPVKVISYDLLAAVSKWSRTPEGEQALARHEPPLHPRDYTMLALLAGTRTSPDRRFPSVPVPGTTADSQAAQRRELSDRRAVTAVLNALLTIGGSAAAAFYASGRLAWKDEWRVLLALSVAIVVAASEGVLYLIWASRRSKPARAPAAARTRRTAKAISDKKTDPVSPSGPSSEAQAAAVCSASSARASGTDADGLRERVPREGHARTT